MSTTQQRTGWFTILRDVATYLLGLLIVLKQAGIFFAPPERVSIELLVIGALCCNVPGLLQIIAWRSGNASTGGGGSAPEPLPPLPQSPAASEGEQPLPG